MHFTSLPPSRWWSLCSGRYLSILIASYLVMTVDGHSRTFIIIIMAPLAQSKLCFPSIPKGNPHLLFHNFK